jgi:hypothetical protein
MLHLRSQQIHGTQSRSIAPEVKAVLTAAISKTTPTAMLRAKTWNSLKLGGLSNIFLEPHLWRMYTAMEEICLDHYDAVLTEDFTARYLIQNYEASSSAGGVCVPLLV